MLQTCLPFQKGADFVERLANQSPIIAPSGEDWRSGFTLNAACIRLDATQTDLISSLTDGKSAPCGVVAVFYRAQPRSSPGFPSPRSSVGLSVFTPDFELIYEWPEPVLVPDVDPNGTDHFGAEDPRVVLIDGVYYMTYCGFGAGPTEFGMTRTCIASSEDLVHWTKLGPVSGDVNHYPNKDAVLFAEKIDGKFAMLHRPMTGVHSEYHIRIALSDELTGPWLDRGEILRALPMQEFASRWVGAGAPPIPLGNLRFLILYHTGNATSEERIYTADVAILDLSNFSSDQPVIRVLEPIEGLLVPETGSERCSPYAYHRDTLHCVFPCGNYVEDGRLVFTYGGGDAYVLAARVDLERLVSEIELRDSRRLAATA
jgi:predicted GH43/DUF377 family glycosyl hydrolase